MYTKAPPVGSMESTLTQLTSAYNVKLSSRRGKLFALCCRKFLRIQEENNPRLNAQAEAYFATFQTAKRKAREPTRCILLCRDQIIRCCICLSCRVDEGTLPFQAVHDVVDLAGQIVYSQSPIWWRQLLNSGVQDFDWAGPVIIELTGTSISKTMWSSKPYFFLL